MARKHRVRFGVDLGETRRAELAPNRTRFAADEVRDIASDKR